MGFALMLTALTLRRQPGACGLIIQSAAAEREGGGLYAPGLAALGLDPARLAVVRVRRVAEALQVMDEALRSGAVASAILEVERGDQLSLSASQRFNFWAQHNDCMGFLVALQPSGNSAAMTRWEVATARSEASVNWARRRGLRRPRLGPPGLELGLRRNRQGVTGGMTAAGLGVGGASAEEPGIRELSGRGSGRGSGRWIVEWDGDACCFRTSEALPASVAGASGHRPAAAVA
jgi:protein ImuA